MIFWYRLEGKLPVPCNTDEYLEWKRQEDAGRVALDDIGTVRVSTVFLGYDASGGFQQRPQFFETMIFGGSFDLDCRRCATWDEAQQQHREVVAKVRENIERQGEE